MKNIKTLRPHIKPCSLFHRRNTAIRKAMHCYQIFNIYSKPICGFGSKPVTVRVLNMKILEVTEFCGESIYAALSHRGNSEEISFEEIGTPVTKTKLGYQKIKKRKTYFYLLFKTARYWSYSSWCNISTVQPSAVAKSVNVSLSM